MKILLVEDDEWIAESLVEALSDQQYAVDTVTDGEASWALIQTFSYDFIRLVQKFRELISIEFGGNFSKERPSRNYWV